MPVAAILFRDSHQYLPAARSVSELHWTHPPERTPGYPLVPLILNQAPPTRSLLYYQIVMHFLAAYLAAPARHRREAAPS
ncbi:MAG: hypothetical protein ACP5U2_04185 [Bryobacteraceae bacterium]